MAWNLRVSAALHQGDRKYMEDQYAIHYECDKETGKFLYAYFGIFDGHGGADAAKYAKTHLHKNITANNMFFSQDSDDVIKAIEEGFLKTHEDMWKEIGKWSPTATGLPSTAGTTASVAFIIDNKLYTGHVGDSGISLGTRYKSPGRWSSEHLTVDHKPDSPKERKRIERMGGKVVPKAGVPRVVWHRPREKGPVRRANQVDSIPFLAVGRALGDLWSYNFDNKQYAISPQPDVQVLPLDPYEHKCLILATDGLWNLLDYKTAVSSVEMIERKWFREAIYEKGHPVSGDPYYHHASSLVNLVLRRWRSRQLRADNTSAIVVMIDPPGHPVQETLARLSARSVKTREEKKQFCASSYITENEGELDAAEKYILEMAGAYTLPSHGEKDRFELHFGKPAIRHAVPADTRKSKATSSIAMYDVIIHKVMSPCKSAGNLPALVDPLDSEPKLRRTLSSNDMKLLQPENERIELDPLPFKDVEEPAPSAAADSESLPLCMRDGHPESVKAETNTRDDEAAISPRTTSEEDEPIQCAMDQASPPSVSPSEVPSPQLDRPSQSLSDSPSRPHPIMRHLKGVAKSLASLHGGKKKVTLNTRSMNLRRKVKNPTIVLGSPLKKRKHGNSLEIFNCKRQKVVPPQVQLTKVSVPELRSGLRPRQK